MRPARARAPLWQRWLVIAVAAFVLIASPPLWATVLITSTAMGMILAAPVISVRRRAQSRSVETGPVATVLGTALDDREPVALTDRQLESHTVIVGASGSGKSTTLLRILTDQIQGGNGVVAIDLKGSPAFADQLARAADQAGRQFRLWTPDGSASWNPLAHGNATQLKDKLISTEWFTEIHYQRAAERYLQSALQVLKAARGPLRPPTLDDVVAALEPSRLEGLLRAVPPELANRVHEYLGTLTADQLSAIRGLATRLAIITESHTGRYLGGPDAVTGAGDPAGPTDSIDLRAALRGEQVVVFSLNSSSYGKLAAQLGALAIQDVITAAGERLSNPDLRHPASVAVDEFSALERGDHVLALNARCREARIGSLVSAQEPTDFERAARGLLNQILGSTAVKIIHRLDVPSSAEMIAQLGGTETVWEQSHQIEHLPLLGDRQTGRSVAREVERFLVHPNVIKSLPTGRAVVITKVPDTRVRITDVFPPAARQARPSERPPGSSASSWQQHPTPTRSARAPSPVAGSARAAGERGDQIGGPDAPTRRASGQARGLPATRRDEPER
ncbi:MAG: type IV secretory system conjugative DNA transfer family protein [Solirubrobacteraceae bacterium]